MAGGRGARVLLANRRRGAASAGSRGSSGAASSSPWPARPSSARPLRSRPRCWPRTWSGRAGPTRRSRSTRTPRTRCRCRWPDPQSVTGWSTCSSGTRSASSATTRLSPSTGSGASCCSPSRGGSATTVLAVVPRHRPPEVVRELGLSPAGWVPVDARTLATSVEGVWAAGDITALALPNGKPLPKAAVFAEGEAEVVANRVARFLGRPAPELRYEGVGSCYIEVGGHVAAKGEGGSSRSRRRSSGCSSRRPSSTRRSGRRRPTGCSAGRSNSVTAAGTSAITQAVVPAVVRRGALCASSSANGAGNGGPVRVGVAGTWDCRGYRGRENAAAAGRSGDRPTAAAGAPAASGPPGERWASAPPRTGCSPRG